jgi:hypothetical protein
MANRVRSERHRMSRPTLGMISRTRTMSLVLATWLPACSSGPSPHMRSPQTGTPTVSDPTAVDRCTLAGVSLEPIRGEWSDSSEWHGKFDLRDQPGLWETAEPDTVISSFRQAVRLRVGAAIDAQALLKRQRDIFARLPAEWRGEATNGTLVLEGRVGEIGPINCLEAMLWKWQAMRYRMIDHPTEFGAFVLRRDGRVRVYMSSADLVGQRLRSAVTELVKADVTAGFALIAHIHNHPFLFDRNVGDRMWTTEATQADVAGALAPSMTDVQLYRNLRSTMGLREARITNGLQTSRFAAAEFDTLVARQN